MTTFVFENLVPGLNRLPATQLQGLKIGILPSHFKIAELEDDVKNCVKGALKRLEELGGTVIEIDETIIQELEKTFEDILLYEAWQVHGDKIESNPEHYGPETLRLLISANAVTESAYTSALAVRKELLPQMSALYEVIDVLITPACPFTAPTTTPPIDTPQGAVEGIYTSIFNITGDPAIVIPIGLDSQGLPIGIQLATNIGSDMKLLSIAQAVETALAVSLQKS